MVAIFVMDTELREIEENDELSHKVDAILGERDDILELQGQTGLLIRVCSHSLLYAHTSYHYSNYILYGSILFLRTHSVS